MKFHLFHDWQAKGVRCYRDISWGLPGCPTTEVLWKCTKCSKVKVTELDGYWDLEDIK